MPKRFNYRFAFISVIFAVFLVYSFITLVNQQIQISEKTMRLEEIEQNIAIQDDENENIKNIYTILSQLNNSENIDDYAEGLEYIERLAREEYDYVNKGERIFINIAGD